MSPTDIDEDVRVRVTDGVATITIDRRAKRNAVRLSTWIAIPRAVVAADTDPSVGLIVMRGAGRQFGAGNDIAELNRLRGDPAAAEQFGAAMAAAMEAVEAAAKPVLMAIEGACYGAAVALALSGDLRVAAADATFAITPARLGAVYLRSDLHRLVAAVGAGRSNRLLFSGEAIDAARAERVGLVDEVFSADAFDSALGDLAATIVAGSPLTLRRTKRMLRTVGVGPAPREDRESLAAFVEATQSADFAEGTAAFLEKRRPRFAAAGSAGR